MVGICVGTVCTVMQLMVLCIGSLPALVRCRNQYRTASTSVQTIGIYLIIIYTSRSVTHDVLSLPTTKPTQLCTISSTADRNTEFSLKDKGSLYIFILRPFLKEHSNEPKNTISLDYAFQGRRQDKKFVFFNKIWVILGAGTGF